MKYMYGQLKNLIYVRNWKDDYGNLPKGIYRYIEMACIEDNNGNDYITCIFEIK